MENQLSYADEDKKRNEFGRSIIDALNAGNSKKALKLFNSLHSADKADFIDRISSDHRYKIITISKKNFDPEILVELDDTIRQSIIEMLGYREVAKILGTLDIDEAAHALARLEEGVQKTILRYINASKKKDLKEILSYPENSAGRMMSKDFVAVPEHWTVGKTLDCTRSKKSLPEEFYEIFIVDPKFNPIGAVLIGSMMHKQRDALMGDIMKKDIKKIETDLDQEDVSYLFTQYGLASVPVINKSGRLVGSISIGDAIEVVEQEAEEDIMHMGGVNETDLHLAVLDIVKSRFPWLFINLITAVIAAFVISLFEGSIHQMVVLAAIMPIVATMGGSAGTQTMTVAVVSIASKELTAINAFRSVIKQLFSCTISGALLAVLAGGFLMLWKGDIELSLIFGVSIVINFILAGFFGITVPLLLNKFDIDPAVASPVVLTALTDLFGFFTFLGLATIFLL